MRSPSSRLRLKLWFDSWVLAASRLVNHSHYRDCPGLMKSPVTSKQRSEKAGEVHPEAHPLFRKKDVCNLTPRRPHPHHPEDTQSYWID